MHLIDPITPSLHYFEFHVAGVSPSKGDYYQGTRGRVILPRQASWGDLLSDYQVAQKYNIIANKDNSL